MHANVERGPIVLSIDEVEFLLDQLPPPDSDEDPMVTKLREKLTLLLKELRAGAEGTGK
ncbi:hypothetical protein BJ742DRAFT_768695 [Cladochytrium replicatum]|nr:hypothetical protein BJ742DRAFT_768695 [Cladochytrium replicatum]